MAIPAWKKFENDVQKHFEERSETERLIYHRFYDTNSAGGFLPAQPGDHLVVWQGIPILIETKQSSKHYSLISCFSSAVPDGQMGSHRLWLRAGAHTFVAFKGKSGYELWWGAYLVGCRVNGSRLHDQFRLKETGTLSDLFRNIALPCHDHYKIHLL